MSWSRVILVSGLMLGAIPCAALAQERVDELLDLPLQDLLQQKVTSVSKQEESAFEAAAAIHVITNDDIRRSGATSLAEALRLAPGIQVSRIDANKWAITARGSAEQFSNKLLVLMDGRSVYTPLFSGVYWDVQDMMLEDVDRIEVIRGPGASLWGANAVNGVINIITKSATQTQGVLVSALAGNEETGTYAMRQGGKVGEHISYRNFIKYKQIDTSRVSSSQADASDAWHVARFGNRIDWNVNESDSLMFQANMYQGQNDQPPTIPLSGTNNTQFIPGDEEMKGQNTVIKYKKKHDNGSVSELQFYLDHITRDNVLLQQDRLTTDVDFQHAFTLNPKNHITLGLGYRNIQDDLQDTPVLDYTPDSRNDSIYSFFMQDKYTVIEDALFITVGSKFEHNDYTGYEVQPTARFSWILPNDSVLWGSVSRAVRTPSRAEHNLALAALSGYISQYGDESFDGEKLIAYELGYRFQPVDTVSVDTAVFYNDYQLRTFSPTAAPLRPEDALSFLIGNGGYGETYGFELASTWAVTDKWNIHANYSFLSIDTHLDPGVVDLILEKHEKRSPKNQVGIQSRYNLTDEIEIDNGVYYTDNISGLGLGLTQFSIPAHIRHDMRIGWRPMEGLELSLVGQNIFDNSTPEFEEAYFSVPSEIERSIYGKVTWQF